MLAGPVGKLQISNLSELSFCVEFYRQQQLICKVDWLHLRCSAKD
jgi:hypothetical protein